MNDTPHRILVVDDEPSITEFVSYALKKEGFFTDVVDNEMCIRDRLAHVRLVHERRQRPEQQAAVHLSLIHI